MILQRTVFALSVLLAGMGSVQAQGLAQDRSSWTVSVTGEGSVAVTPDLAEVRAGVVSQGKTAKEASEANSRAMGTVLLTLKAGGIADIDIQTARFSIQPLYEANRSPSQRIIGFQASNQIAIRIRDTTTIGDVIDRLVGAGANEFSGVSFQVSAPSKLLDAARADAMADARRKAEIYAGAAGLALGRATAIVEEGAAPPAAFRTVAASAATPIVTGQETLRVSVSVTFELLR
jgi:uncharacterized protein YggE